MRALLGFALLCLGCQPVNEPPPLPFARLTLVGPDPRVGTPTRFSGADSTDPRFEPLRYEWRVPLSPPGALPLLRVSGGRGELLDLTADHLGRYAVQLVVHAGDRTSAPATLVFDVDPPANRPPVAALAITLFARVGEEVTLDATASRDPDGDPLTFAWSQVDGPPIAGPLSDAPRWSFTAETPGTYRFTVKVSDADFTRTATADVLVRPAIDAGVPDAGPPAAPDVFSASQVFLSGRVDAASCQGAIASWATPDRVIAGIGCNWLVDAVVRPTDGRLLYLNEADATLREFHCDACDLGPLPYPTQLLANDPVVPTPCAATREGFLVGADGQLLVRCGSEWRDLAGTLRTFEPLLALGADGWALTRGAVVQLTTQAHRPLVGAPVGAAPARVRWVPPDAFLAVYAREQGLELWSITLDGVASRIGAFGALPPEVASLNHLALDASGLLYELGLEGDALGPVLVRRAVNQPTTVVLRKAPGHRLDWASGSLFTGP